MKKFLAFLLAITMIATFIPTAFAADTDGEGAPVYDVEVECDIESLTVSLGMIGASGNSLSTLNYENTNGVFRYIRSSITDSNQALNTVSDADAYTASKLLYAGGSPEVGHITLYGGQWIAFEVVVPTRGIYTLDVKRRVATAGGNVSVYITDDDTYYSQSSFSLDNFGAAVGSYSCYKNNSYSDVNSIKTEAWDTTSVFENKLLEAGKYVIVYKATGSSSTKAGISAFTLKGISATDENIGYTVKYDLSKALVENNFGWSSRPAYSTLDYNETNGFYRVIRSSEDAYTGSNYIGVGGTAPKYLRIKDGRYICFEIKVPKAGIYTLKADYMKRPKIGDMSVYVTDKETYDKQASFAIANLGNVGQYSYNCASDSEENEWVSFATIAEKLELSAGEYIITFQADGTEGTISSFELVSGLLGTLTTDMGASIKVSDTKLTVGETASVEYAKAYFSDGSEDTSKIASGEYESSNTSVVTVDGSTITAVGAGTADITTTVGEATAKRTINVTDIEAEDAKTITIAVDDNGDGYATVDSSKTVGEEYEVTAQDIANKEFRCWVRGSAENGTWVSNQKTYTFTVSTNTYLTAVYSDAVAEGTAVTEYYNWNGAYLGTDAVTPTLTGYSFKGWVTTKVSDILSRAVAQYTAEDTEYNVTNDNSFDIYVEGGKYVYDAKVTCEANKAVYWYRDGKCVDYGTTYIFNVWGATKITTSETGSTGPKVMLDEVEKTTDTTEKSYMIEYDKGDKNIVEVGILFGQKTTPTIDVCDQKMTSQRNSAHGQFTATSDYTYARGFLIYNDNGTYRVIYAD